jgi:redox-sensitive bicupin YhaK (pirin superfamily)
MNTVTKNTNRQREISRVILSVPTSDGAGVKLRRSIGNTRGLYLDPFLMLDEFGTDNPGDYIAGFPAHPHRGFETVTYMLDGRMQHKDHLGNVGDLGPGSVQWMTAGRGVIHSEMPLQESGRMRGFQLWINLPAKEKMQPAAYQDIAAENIPVARLQNGGRVKVIAGTFIGNTIGIGNAIGVATLNRTNKAGEINGVINPSTKRISTDPLYFDVELPANARFEHPITSGYNAVIYSYEGDVLIGEKPLPKQAAAVLSAEGNAVITAGESGSRFILLAGKPIGEPVVQYGPFVMNMREEIEQALADYRDGNFVESAV